MRSDLYFREFDEIKDEEKRKEQIKELEQQVKKYLENGGKITVIPEGVSSFSSREDKNQKSGEN